MKTFVATIFAACFIFVIALVAGMLGYSKEDAGEIIMFFGCISGFIALFRAD